MRTGKSLFHSILVGALILACLRPAFAQEMLEIHPDTLSAPLRNPFKGFVPWIGDLDMHHLSSMQLRNFSWRPLEPQEGQYNWAGFEAYWDQLWDMGLRVGFRISTATPGGYGIDVPQWLIDLGVEMRDYSIDGYTGKAPDWDSPVFLEKHIDFIKALGARYNNDPRVAWADIGSYGFWGEWHVYRNPGLAASDSSKKKILDAYFEAFPDKRLVIAFDDDFATRYVTEHGEGIRNDCLGTSASNNWYLESLKRIDPTLNERAWKIGIITGEFCGSDQGALEGTTTRFQLNLNFIKQTHWSFIGTAGGNIPPINDEHQANLDLLHKTLGYRYILRTVRHPRSARAGQSFELTIDWDNVGVAPFYYPWPIVIDLTDRTGNTALRHTLAQDIRTLLPGITTIQEAIPLPAGLAPGTYDIRLAIWDVDRDEPGVQLAITGKDELGRYRLSQITIQGASTGIEDQQGATPASWHLGIYPNPVRSTATLVYRLDSTAPARLRLYDITGRLVRTLVDARTSPGEYRLQPDFRNLSTGLYILAFEAGAITEKRKVLILK